ncbi:MAG: hypothetical protein IH865_13750, partial [Chloroflexi bacterium]|nr:hypothetical protein [Chloroflexota bacterium]
MRTSKVHTGTIVGVLALPLIAILAMVMFFSFSQSGPEQAEAASQGSATAMRLQVPANAEVGSKFNVSIVADLTPNVDIGGFSAQVIVDEPNSKVNYNGAFGTAACEAALKVSPVSGGFALCDLFSPVLTGGVAFSVLTSFTS